MDTMQSSVLPRALECRVLMAEGSMSNTSLREESSMERYATRVKESAPTAYWVMVGKTCQRSRDVRAYVCLGG